MQLPALLGGKLSAAKAGADLVALSRDAAQAGYELGKFLKEEIAEAVAAETLARKADFDAVEAAIEDAGEEEGETPLAPGTKR